MIFLLPALTTIALVDSLSIVPLSIVALLMLLAGSRPYLRTGAFLAGIFVSYLAGGLMILFGLEAVFEELNAYLVRLWHQPEPEELIFQIFIGTVLVICAVLLARRRKNSGDARVLHNHVPCAGFSFGGRTQSARAARRAALPGGD